MRFPLPVFVLAASVFVVGCNSLDNPLSGINPFHTGHDARVYNSQTGQWEWPKESEKRRSRVAGLASSGTTPTPAPERKSDGRYYDPQKGQWMEVQEERKTTQSSKRPSAPAVVLMATPKPVGTPQAQRSERASGTYNASTGQIEWTDFDPAPKAKPTPAPKAKKWYWPF